MDSGSNPAADMGPIAKFANESAALTTLPIASYPEYSIIDDLFTGR